VGDDDRAVQPMTPRPARWTMHPPTTTERKTAMLSVIKSFSNRVAAPAAMAAGAAWAADGVLQLIHPQTSSDTLVVGAAGYANLALFVAALILVSPAFVALGEKPGTRVALRAGIAAAAGTVLLAITGISSLAHGRDYSFFPVVAVVTNGAWLLGSIVIAVALKRTRTAPKWAVYGLPVAWIGSIPLATHGGGLITGAYWMAASLLVLGAERVGLAPASTPV
jgi:hypothetical protein